MPANSKTRKWLDRIDAVGNALPDPVFIFLGLIALLVAVSVATTWSWLECRQSGDRRSAGLEKPAVARKCREAAYRHARNHGLFPATRSDPRRHAWRGGR